jgi:hypothetical protein
LKMEPTGSPETSVLNQPTLRNIPEDGRFQVNCSESLRSRIFEFSIPHTELDIRISVNEWPAGRRGLCLHHATDAQDEYACPHPVSNP